MSRDNRKKRPLSRAFNIIKTTLLLVLCVGGVELLVVRHVDPPLYHRLTDPVYSAMRRTAADIKQTAGQARASVSAWWEEQHTEPQESQLASDPLLASGDGDIYLNDPTLTELTKRGSYEILTGGSCEIRYFAQSDVKWKDMPFGRDNIGQYGCGPTALAMVICSLTDQQTDPAQMAAWAAANGYWAPGSGSYHSLVENAAAAFGLQSEQLEERTVESLRTHLSGGEIAIALMKPGHFTQSGHFIVLRGGTLSGNILVADPNSRTRSLQAWNPQLILDELSDSTDNGAPIWLLSPIG